MRREFQIQPYTIHLEMEHNAEYCGTVVRLPDEVEGSFNHIDGLLALLEGMSGHQWWQANHVRIRQQLLSPNDPSD